MSSNTGRTLTTVTRSIVVAAPVGTAFEVFIDRFDQIKPRAHNLLSVDVAESVFERHVDGYLYDRGVDGSVCRWARVLAYEPPQRLVFSWDISPLWQLESDLERTSEVEVRFIAEGDDRTRVLLEHRYLDRHGNAWRSLRDGISGDEGWPLYLRRFADLLPSGAR